MREPSLAGRAREWWREHERLGIVAWLLGTALALGALAVWGVALGGAERAARAWDARWLERLAQGERLCVDGHFGEAAAFLEQLDGEFPARSVKHRWDRERERLLGLLAKSYTELDRKREALATLDRLVAFDPRNYKNHFALAEGCFAFDEPDRGREALQAVLAIHPTHLPSLQELAASFYDGSRYEAVVALYRAYLDAWLLAPMTLSLGEASATIEVPVDGLPHRIEAPLAIAAGWSGEACLSSRGYSVRIASLEIVAPARVGVAEPLERAQVAPGDGWVGQDAVESQGRFSASGVGSRICHAVGPLSAGGARVVLEITAFKALPPALWAQVQTSYRNQLENQALEEARERSLVGGCPEAGSIFED
jgi:tetratricopeptide (TPR) repeat protein